MNALFIGRFQPFHKGHLKLIVNLYKKYNKIMIGIGSSQYSHKKDNPFTSDERKKMISETLKANNVKNFQIILIPDIHNPPKWVEHVLQLTNDFDVVITNNSFTKKLFEEKGFKVRSTDLYDKDKFSGTVIRKKMINNENWIDLVPETVYDYIKNIDMKKRLL